MPVSRSGSASSEMTCETTTDLFPLQHRVICHLRMIRINMQAGSDKVSLCCQRHQPWCRWGVGLHLLFIRRQGVSLLAAFFCLSPCPCSRDCCLRYHRGWPKGGG